MTDPDTPRAAPLTAEQIDEINTLYHAAFTDAAAWKHHATHLVTENTALRDRLARAEAEITRSYFKSRGGRTWPH